MDGIIQEHLTETVSVKVIEVKKNNGIVLDWLTILKTGELIAPTIYLNDYYQEHQTRAMKLSEVVQGIIKIYEENYMPNMIDGETFTDFENVKNIVCFKLINWERNSGLLEKIPYVPVLDLAMVFYVLIDNRECGEMTALVTNEHIDYWKVGVEELKDLAVSNSQRLLSAEIKTMQEVMLDIVMNDSGESNAAEQVGELFSEEDAHPMYVLTNSV